MTNIAATPSMIARFVKKWDKPQLSVTSIQRKLRAGDNDFTRKLTDTSAMTPEQKAEHHKRRMAVWRRERKNKTKQWSQNEHNPA